MPLPVTRFPCCRVHDLFGAVENYRPRRGLAEEIYWLKWQQDSASTQRAMIRVARLGREAMFFREYRPSTFGKMRRSHGRLSPEDWRIIEDAVIGSNFWMLDERESPFRRVLGGASWYFFGSRKGDEGVRTSHRSLARRADDQNPCADRCPGTSVALSLEPRQYP